MSTGTLLSIQVGMPKPCYDPSADDSRPAEWISGFHKSPVAGGVWLGQTNLRGDGQADLEVHGGIHKAVNVYASEHFPYWCKTLNLAAVDPGAFGENFTTAGLLETEVCIGDTYRIGAAMVQITQPRQPCWKLARRWAVKGMVKRVSSSGKTGWYFRTLQEGCVEAGAGIELVERPFPQWTVDAANRIMYAPAADPAAAEQLARCPALSPSWQETLSKRASRT